MSSNFRLTFRFFFMRLSIFIKLNLLKSFCCRFVNESTGFTRSYCVANAAPSNSASFARNRSKDIRSICQTDIYLPVRSGLSESRRLRRASRQNRLNHGDRATQNANRVYHYDLTGYRLADYVPSIRMFYCLVFTYLHESAVSSDQSTWITTPIFKERRAFTHTVTHTYTYTHTQKCLFNLIVI